MSDSIQLALIGAATTALPSIIAAWFAYRASVHAEAASLTSKHTEENTNHKMDEFLAVTAKASKAEGVLEGQANQEGRKHGN